MATRRVTMADVARRAGVSRTAASFVLAGRTDMRIADATQKRIRQSALELGYRPNLTARGLRTAESRTFALISDTIATTAYAGKVVHGALDAAMAEDRVLFVAETEGNPVVEARLIDGMLDRQVDGFVYATMYTREVTPPAVLLDHPVVFLNCLPDDFPAPSVIPDEYGAGCTAAQTLLNAGHREGIYVIGGRHAIPETPSGVFAGRERMNGIEKVLESAGVSLAGVAECDWQPPDGYREVRGLLRRGHRPRALVCCNDRLSLGAYQALAEVGLSVPGDVSVVSFDDSDLASWLRPSLTSIALPHRELGRRAVELLLAGQLRPGYHRIPMPARLRSSVAPVTPERGTAESAGRL